MFTKNFYSFLLLSGGAGECTFKASSGSTQYCTSESFKENADNDGLSIWPLEALKFSYNTEGAGVYFGSGSTAPTVDDYKPESVLSGISVTTQSEITVSKTSTYYEGSATFNVRNTGNSSKTINEVGLFICIHSGPSSFFPCMVERQVFATPIVLAAGASEQITYKIRFNFPTT